MIETAEIPNISKGEMIKEVSRRKHLEFMRYCWRKAETFKVGKQTTGICSEIDNAFNRYREGKSTYLAITVPNRHGKTDITSRFGPAHFLGEFPEGNIIVTGCDKNLAQGFSRDCQSIMTTEQYQQLYPEVTLTAGNRSVASWSVNEGIGNTFWCGLKSGIMGKGASLLVIDDFVSSRADAESETIREKTWLGFSDDALTRLAPVHIVLIVATSWHIDDIFGRIKKHMREDPQYPQFKFIKYPAFSEEYPGEQINVNGIQMGMLFPEMYSPQWYATQKASKSNYSFWAIMMCEPIEHGENMINTGKINYIHDLPTGLRWVRAWDLASSEQKLKKEDPDYTASVAMAVRWIPSAIPGIRTPLIYLKDGIVGRWKASTRNDIIKDTAIREEGIRMGTEAFGASYKDAYITLKDILMGFRHVEELRLPGDKAAKGEPLVAPFEAGNVYVYYPLKKDETPEENKKPEWVEMMIDQLETAPFGAHDDIFDSLAMDFDMCKNDRTGLFHIDSKIVNEEKIADQEVINAIFMKTSEAKAYILTGYWQEKGEKLHISNETVCDTIDELLTYLKPGKKSRNVGNDELNSDSNRSLLQELMLKQVYIHTDDSFDALGSLYFLNAMIDKKNFTVSSKCRELLIGMQNDTDLKELSVFSSALLYIINNINIIVKQERFQKEYKPFNKESNDFRTQQERELRLGGLAHKGYKPGWK
jgi:phage terminase large subunit-like protein